MVSSSFTKCLILISLCGSAVSFNSPITFPQQKTYRSQLYSATPYYNNNDYDEYSSSTYFNAPSSAADEIRWARIVNSRFSQQRNIASSSTPQQQQVQGHDIGEPSRLRQTLHAAKQAFRESREIEAYNQINDLEKLSRRMDGPTRSRLANAQPIKSIDDIKDRYPLPNQSQESVRQQGNNFVVQYSDAETLDLQKSFGDLADGTMVDYAVIRAAAMAGKQAASILGGKDPENWID